MHVLHTIICHTVQSCSGVHHDGGGGGGWGGGGEYYSNQYNNIMLLIHSMDVSSEEDERTLTMVDPSYGAEDDSSCVHHTPAVAPCIVAETP